MKVIMFVLGLFLSVYIIGCGLEDTSQHNINDDCLPGKECVEKYIEIQKNENDENKVLRDCLPCECQECLDEHTPDFNPDDCTPCK